MAELYSLPDGWEWKTLSDIFNIERGGSPRPIKDYITYDEDGINWIKISDATKGDGKYIESTEQKIKPSGLKNTRLVVDGDFIMSNSMSFGKPYIVKTKGAIHDGWLLMREKIEKTDKDFFYYLLSSNYMYEQFSSKASGTTVKNLNIDMVKTTNIPLPPFEEQKRIVVNLDNLFAKIDKAIALHQKNIDEADIFMASVLNDVFVELEEKYGVKEINSLFKIKSGNFLPAKNMVEDGEINVYGGNGINGKHNEFNLSGENIIIGRVGALCGNVRCVNDNIWLTDNAFYISEYFEEIDKNFLAQMLIHIDLGSSANKSAQPVISYKSICEMTLPLPPLKTQQKVVSYLDEISNKMEKIKNLQKKKMQSLKELKASILDKAFKGEL